MAIIIDYCQFTSFRYNQKLKQIFPLFLTKYFCTNYDMVRIDFMFMVI